MDRFIEVKNAEELKRFCALPGLSSLTADTISIHRPDSSLLLADEKGGARGRCSLWWTNVPMYFKHRLGLIGHYAALDPAAARETVKTACDRLASQRCTMAIGPMDGNTWRRYRLLTDRGSEPIFFLEPDNPDDWPAHFIDGGFHPVAQYYSALNSNLEEQDPRLPQIAERISKRGISIRPLNPQRFQEELRGIYTVSLAGFSENFLYTPITEKEFAGQYSALEPYIRPELALIAEWKGTPVGYVFAIPDVLEGQRGQAGTTIIVKTLAVHPEHGGGGLGSLLTARCQEAAHRLGYRRAIHALMHETNRSRKISGHTATTIRRYTLYAKELAQVE